MTKEEAIKLWEDIFGEKIWVQDCFGTWIYKWDYGDTEKIRVRPGNKKSFKYGWEIDHIKPKSSFKNEEEADFENNYEPMHFEHNRSKSDNLEFNINDRKYKVVTCEICKNNHKRGYGIEDVQTGKRIDWKYMRRSYYG